MPFQSEKQRRYLWANEPEIARDWADTYGSRIKKDDGGITQLVKSGPGRPGYRGDDARKSAAKMGKGHMGTARHGPAPGSHHPPGPVSKPDPTPTVRHHSGDDDTEAKKLNITRERDAVIRRLRDDKKAEATEKLVAKYARHKDKPSFVPSYLKALGPMAYLPGHKAKAIADRRAYANSIGMGEWFNSLSDDEVISTDMMNFLAYSDAVPKGETYADYQADKGSPGLKYSGNVGRLEKFKKADGTYGYKEITGGEGPIYYPGYVPGGTPQGGGGGGTTATEVVEDTPSGFQESLTTSTSSPFDYYVGQDPTAKNLAWGEKFGVDPRTMYKTSWADGGRIPAAYGGIMDTDTGRRAYGFGSFFSKIGKAAKKVLKSPIGKAALLGAGAYYLGGGNLMGLQRSIPGSAGFSMANLRGAPMVKQLLTKKGAGNAWDWGKVGIGALSALPFFMGGQDEDEDEGFDYAGAKNKYWDELMRIKAGAMAGTLDPTKFRYQGVKDGGRIGMYAGGQSTPSDYTMEDAMMTTTQDKLGGITDVMKQADLSRQGSVGQFYAAHGGSADDNNARLEARVKELQDEGLDFNSAMAQAMKELSSGKAQGGRIGYAGGSGSPPITLGQNIQAPGRTPPPPPRPHPMPAPQPNRMGGMPGGMNPMMNRPMMNPMMGGMHPMMNRPMMNPMGGRRMAQEGGLMDLGGMEKDYRNDGGFVPLGGEEKADDVPARLSKNEFVFTADAVRGAGDGDIDKGAEIMENIMKNLEQGGQISEETQGNTGAQEMFGVSERLSEVV